MEKMLPLQILVEWRPGRDKRRTLRDEWNIYAGSHATSFSRASMGCRARLHDEAMKSRCATRCGYPSLSRLESLSRSDKACTGLPYQLWKSYLSAFQMLETRCLHKGGQILLAAPTCAARRRLVRLGLRTFEIDNHQPPSGLRTRAIGAESKTFEVIRQIQRISLFCP
jgi:hypothetical protein